MKNKSKVILLPCNSYREELVNDSLKKGLKLLGGLEALISKDEKILLKPNLLKRAEVEKAVITHPAVVGMFGKLLKEEGYERVILADSCGHGNTTKVIAGTGMDTYLQELGIPAVDFSEGIRTPGKRVYSWQRASGNQLRDRSVQNENPCAGADHRGGEEQLWIYLRPS